MRRPLTVAAITLLLAVPGAVQAAGSSVKFDVVTYTAPAGWAQEASSARLRKYSLVEGSSFCLIAVYASTAGTGSLERDFQQEWQNLVVQPLRPDDAPETEPGPGQGVWRNLNGAALYTRDGAQELAMLSTFSAPAPHNRRVSILLAGNDRACVDHLEALIDSVKLATPTAARPPATTPAKGAPSAPASPPASSASSSSSKVGNGAGSYAFTTTTFDGGWTATATPDWVEVRQGATTARLHYLVPYTDATRNLGNVELVEHFWNTLISPRYRAARLMVAPSEPGVGRVYFGESDATELATGRRVHVALHLTSENGQARVTEIVTSDGTTRRALFPTLESMGNLRRYNRFAVAASDLRGTWENSSSAYGLYYSTVTGEFAGMRGASTSDKFTFGPDGSYTHDYVGVSSSSGSQSVSQGRNAGTIRGGPWEFTTTDKAGKQTTLLAEFEAIRGGRILHLQNKQYSGLQYQLVRTR